jgi:5-methylthioribose kinase
VLILNEENLTGYIRGHLAEKLGLASSTVIKNVASAGGGLVSAVFKAQVGKENLYFKQAIPGKLDKVRELVGDTVPADAFVVWYAERQFAEVKALQIVKQAVTDYFVPTVYYHDADNNIMVLSEVCGGDGVVLAEVMNTEINLRHAEILGENIAKVANFTYGKFDSLRDDQLEAKLKEVKYRYEVRDVWENITKSETKKRVIDKVSRSASVSSEMNSVLVHGDFHDRNIIIGENCCGTYDLEECHWGDPAEDIGKLTTSEF